MPRFAANLSLLFPELDFLDKFGAARACRFDAVEFLFPYSYPAERVLHAMQQHQLSTVLFNLPAGDWARGERGLACDPRRTAEFREGVALALDYARTLGVSQLHCLAGLLPGGITPAEAHASYVANLRYAAGQLAPHGITLLIEPINTFDMPGYFLTGSDQAAAVIAECAAPNLFLQFDMYHMQRMEGDAATGLRKHFALIRHMQLADVPGRHEPGTGSMDYPALFALVDQLGYSGWIGCEYHPLGDTAAGLEWLRSLRT